MNQIIFALIFSAFAIGTRLVDHAPNFAAVGALALWAGIYLPRKYYLTLPVVVMFASDSVVGFYDWRVMFFVYGSFVLMAVIGLYLKDYKGPAIVIGSLLGSAFFYVATNFAVWAFGTMYAHDWTGLINCFYLALPFFRNTLYSDLIYGFLFVGIYQAATFYGSKRVSALFFPTFSKLEK